MEVGTVHNERGAEAVQMSGVFGMVDIVLEEHLKWVKKWDKSIRRRNQNSLLDSFGD